MGAKSPSATSQILAAHSDEGSSGGGLVPWMMSLWAPRLKARNKPRTVSPPMPVTASVGEILAGLDGEQLVFQNVASRYGTIDHVLISRDHGIFLIETKPHQGRVSVVDSKLRVNGRLPEKNFVAQSLMNTYWLIELIREVLGCDAGIVPLIVFTNAVVEPGRPLKGIPITDRSRLEETIRQNASPLPAALWEARERIAAALAGA